MKRQAITDGNGQWFDIDKAEVFKEETDWNGSNHISRATGSQFDHEFLYMTKSGKFILNRFSDYQGRGESYILLSKEEAAEWFASQSFSDEVIPDVFKQEIAHLEIG